MRGENVRLPGIRHFGVEEILETAVDFVGDRIQELAALCDVHGGPRALKSRARCLDGGVNLLLAGFGHHPDQAAVDRRHVLERLARFRADELAVDEIEDLLLCHRILQAGVRRRLPS